MPTSTMVDVYIFFLKLLDMWTFENLCEEL